MADQDKSADVEEQSEREPMLPEAKNKDTNEVKPSEGEDKTDSAGLGKRESSLLEEMEKYLESNNVPVDNVK